jgi:hypothetical protein
MSILISEWETYTALNRFSNLAIAFCGILHLNLVVCCSQAERSKAWTVFARLNAGPVGLNSTQGMAANVLRFILFVLTCV